MWTEEPIVRLSAARNSSVMKQGCMLANGPSVFLFWDVINVANVVLRLGMWNSARRHIARSTVILQF
jgi:hypothetical protein